MPISALLNWVKKCFHFYSVLYWSLNFFLYVVVMLLLTLIPLIIRIVKNNKYNWVYYLGDKIANEKKAKDSTIRNTQSEDSRISGPHIVTTHPSGNLVISIGTKVENRPASKKNYSEDSETEIKHPAKYQKTKNAMNIPKSEEDQSSNSLKVTEETNLYRVDNKSTIIKSSEFNI